MLKHRNYDDVSALKGGIQGWQAEGYILEGKEPQMRLKAA